MDNKFLTVEKSTDVTFDDPNDIFNPAIIDVNLDTQLEEFLNYVTHANVYPVLKAGMIYPLDITLLSTASNAFEVNLFTAYEKWVKECNYPLCYTDINEFINAWIIMSGNVIRAKGYNVTDSIYTSVNELLKHYDVCEILELYFIVKYSRTLKNYDNINNVYQYTRKMFTEKDNYTPTNPGEDFFGSENEFNSLMDKWKRTDAIPFIRYVLYKNMDSTINMELAYYLPIIKAEETSDKELLIIDPSPDVVDLLIKATRRLNRLILIFTNKPIAYILKLKYAQVTVCYYEINTSTIYECDKKSSYNMTSQKAYAKEVIPNTSKWEIDTAFTFVRPWNESIIVDYIKLINGCSSEINRIQLFASASWFKNYREQILRDNSLIGIVCLPNCDSNKAERRLKSLAITLCKNGSTLANDTIVKLSKSWIVKTAEESYLVTEPWHVNAPKAEFGIDNFNHIKEVLTIYNLYRVKPDEVINKRNTKYYDFSKEIRLWYSWSNGHGRYTYYKIPDDSELNSKQLGRGKKLMGPIPFNTKLESDVTRSLNKYLLTNNRLIDAINKDINNYGRFNEISLKSCWYIYRANIANKDKYNEKVAILLWESEYISNIVSEDDYNLERIIKETATIEKSHNLKQYQLLRQLNIIFSVINDHEYFKWQTITNFLADKRSSDKGKQMSRKHLAKRLYLHPEEIKIRDFLIKNINANPSFLAALICFYTGCTNNEVVALTWNDYNALLNLEVHTLSVTKRWNNNSIVSIDKSTPNMYRVIPIVKELDDVLKEYKKKILTLEYVTNYISKPGMSLNQLPLVHKYSNEKIINLSVEEVKNAKKSVEEMLNPKKIIGNVNIDGKDVSTDFNTYMDDKFRANIMAQLSNVLDVDDIHYILGIQPQTTYAKHYCDYRNPFVLIKLKYGMERWSVTTLSDNNTDPIQTKKIRETNKIIQNSVERQTLVANVSINSSTQDNVTLLLNDSRGCECTICKIRNKD